MANSQKQFRDVVTQTLEENMAARDNDWLLFGGVIQRLRGLEYMKNISLFDFLVQASKDPTIPKPGTPTRYRSDIQKVREDLRGELYEPRQSHSNDWRKEFSRNG